MQVGKGQWGRVLEMVKRIRALNMEVRYCRWYYHGTTNVLSWYCHCTVIVLHGYCHGTVMVPPSGCPPLAAVSGCPLFVFAGALCAVAWMLPASVLDMPGS